MKASVAMMLTAIDILRDLDAFGRPIVWLINTEEEVGSPVSRQLYRILGQGVIYSSLSRTASAAK